MSAPLPTTLSNAVLAILASAGVLLAACSQPASNPSTRGQFLQMAVGAPENRAHAALWIADHWQPGFASMVVEALPFVRDPQARATLIELLQAKTGQDYGHDIDAWQRWVWRDGPPPHPRYAQVKATLYGIVDPNYQAYFRDRPATAVQLDEVQWVGISRRDDLHPLKSPAMVSANAAMIDDDEPVYGLQIQGQARAYPKKTVAQHGVLSDRVAQRRIVLFHDSLTGSSAAYSLPAEEPSLDFAASGFTFRGDSLLYDRASGSLWSGLRGKPVVGPRVDRPVSLTPLATVETRWSNWRRRHPETRVIASDPDDQAYLADQLNYRRYVAEDRMLDVADSGPIAPDTDIIGIRLGNAALAIDTRHLAEQPVSRHRLNNQRIVVLSQADGGRRAYLSGEVELQRLASDAIVLDSQAREWRIGEQALHGPSGELLPRIPIRQARWSAWQGAFDNSRLVH